MCYSYGCDNSSKSQVMFFDTLKCGHMKNIMLGQNTLHVTKSYTYLGHIITDNLCDEADIKAKVGCLYGRSNILLRKFYFCSERVKNRLFSSYCSNLHLCSLWASISRFIVSYNNAFRILHNLHMSQSLVLWYFWVTTWLKIKSDKLMNILLWNDKQCSWH